MKRYSPGASTRDDYYFICDCCEVSDGRAVIIWLDLPQRKGHFALCFDCLIQLYFRYANNQDTVNDIVINRASIPEVLRNKIFERDSFQCVKCGSTTDLQLDHIIPFSRGGRTIEDNLQTLCMKCNIQKGTNV